MLKHSKFEKNCKAILHNFWEHSLLVMLPFLLSVEYIIVKYGATSHRSYWPVRLAVIISVLYTSVNLNISLTIIYKTYNDL